MENKVEIPKRFNTSQEDRDQSKYLGIDGTIIPWKYFKGVIREDGIRFTSAILCGVEFIYYEDLDGCEILTNNKNQYVTEEDLENDVWYVLYRGYRGRRNLEVEKDIIKKKYNNVLARYYNGEEGLIKDSEKLTHPNGDYTWVEFSFDTEHGKWFNLLDNMRRHMEFIYHYDLKTSEHNRRAILKVNEELFMNGQFGELFERIVSLMMVDKKTITPTEIINKFKDLYIPVPTVGYIRLEVTPECNNFILIRDK